MNCAVHTDVDAVGYCRNCGKALCSTCVRPVRDVLYCEDCLATIMGIPAATPAALPGPLVPPPGALPPVPSRPTSSPGVAFVLGLFPGLGAVYNGEYNKALIHIVVFIAMIFGLNTDIGDAAETVLSLLVAGFILYMAFDAMRVAKARNLGETPVDPLESWSKNRPVGPIILIALGVLFLLNNFNWFPFWRIQRLWPLVLIGVGILMFRNRLEGRS
ncbi:MAG: B-box zinc finger protein [Acidobacteria bacterium Pan2503]|uniref:B-box zinc finger protein n=1 Tax=Candidatus Acidiferrum panamense TaxID=2741543 RepID=A0A7V8SVS1_9BACT|nr:B-box zinc finger protein [Candidatus Acidoferrum panamensis]